MARRRLPPQVRLGLVVVVLAVAAWQRFGPGTSTGTKTPGSPTPTTERTTSSGESGEAAVLEAFRARRSDLQMEVQGRVVFLFPPDRDGRPHQRFLLELPSGHTLKIAHNLTLSTPIPLTKGDTVRVYGEYEYNDKGGVIHWTHKDPRQRHAHGWIEHKGLRYQ